LYFADKIRSRLTPLGRLVVFFAQPHFAHAARPQAKLQVPAGPQTQALERWSAELIETLGGVGWTHIGSNTSEDGLAWSCFRKAHSQGQPGTGHV